MLVLTGEWGTEDRDDHRGVYRDYIGARLCLRGSGGMNIRIIMRVDVGINHIGTIIWVDAGIIEGSFSGSIPPPSLRHK